MSIDTETTHEVCLAIRHRAYEFTVGTAAQADALAEFFARETDAKLIRAVTTRSFQRTP